MRCHENERKKIILLVLLFVRSYFRMTTFGRGLATAPEVQSILYTRCFASWSYCHLQVTGCYWSSSWSTVLILTRSSSDLTYKRYLNKRIMKM
jgi:hypothetical protein